MANATNQALLEMTISERLEENEALIKHNTLLKSEVVDLQSHLSAAEAQIHKLESQNREKA